MTQKVMTQAQNPAVPQASLRYNSVFSTLIYQSLMNNNDSTLSRLDRAFGQFLSQKSHLTASEQKDFANLVAQLSFAQTQGHTCLAIDISTQQLCLRSGLTQEIDILNETLSNKTLPLVLEQGRLYLQRYWFYEFRLTQQLKQKITQHYVIADLDQSLERYFPTTHPTIDWQRLAAKMALQNAFAIITGGPGTGKTTTVVKILALLQEVAAHPLHIALAAPTGKAAMRLQESIGQHKNQLPCTIAIQHSLPEKVMTIHRLLGAKPNSPYFYHDAQAPLAYDLVVVDEASMVDLALMSKLVDALKPDARLLLLGDKDQLASVESGAILANLTAALPEQTVELQTTHRFKAEIRDLASAINQQQATLAWELIQNPSCATALLLEDPITYIAEKQHAYLKLIKTSASYQEIYTAFMRFQALCSNRQGPNSITDVNYQVEQLLARQNLINLNNLWYSGRPIIITANNHNLHLYNGDIGICLPDPEQGGKLRVYFQLPNGSVKKYLPARISQCETVFAMTVHKSQGSEFNEILLLLPETLNPILSKELLYTAITRAKQTVRIVSNFNTFSASILQRIQRNTGLVAKLSVC